MDSGLRAESLAVDRLDAGLDNAGLMTLCRQGRVGPGRIATVPSTAGWFAGLVWSVSVVCLATEFSGQMAGNAPSFQGPRGAPLQAKATKAKVPVGLSGTRARYLVLTAQPHTPPPFAAVDVVWGPTVTQPVSGQWWQLEIRTNADPATAPVVVVRALTRTEPLSTHPDALQFSRYIVRVPALGETLDYRNRHTGAALLPGWQEFRRYFVPHRAAAARLQDGVPETCELLGHVLTLAHVWRGESWETWADAKVLGLDPELLVGTGRNFKDAEGRRLPQQPQRQDYTYVPFSPADYTRMFEAGMNLFVVSPAQEACVRAQPVFYIRGPEGQPPLEYPTDLYRANYLGPVMFMDEPAIIMVGDKLVHHTLRYFSDAAVLVEKRTRAIYLGDGPYGAYRLERALRQRGVNLGDLRLMQPDIPSWETLLETTFYQMKGGGSGLVHEGRYQLEPFNRAVERFTGQPRSHTAAELLQYHFALLRGGTRPFGKHWGTAIYGQCDTNLAPLAVTMAYDLGARYVWFWTSDHDHHVPWPEQLALAQRLQRHAAQRPRPCIFGPPPKLDVAIVIPNGYFLSLENLWWVRALDQAGQNEASRRYQRLMRRALEAVHRCFDQNLSFDITVDDGRPITGYRRLVRLDDRP